MMRIKYLVFCLLALGLTACDKKVDTPNSPQTSSASSVAPTGIPDSSQVQSEQSYDDPAIPYLNDDQEYRHAMFGDYQQNKLVVVQGKVTQILEDGTVRLETGMQFYGLSDLIANGIQYSGREIVVNFGGKPRVLLGDIVGIKGRYNGVDEFELFDKTTSKIPAVTADYYATSDLDAFYKGRKDAIAKVQQDAEDAKNKAAQQQALDDATIKYNQSVAAMKMTWQNTPHDLQLQLKVDQADWAKSLDSNCAKPDPVESMNCKNDAATQRMFFLQQKQKDYATAAQTADSNQPAPTTAQNYPASSQIPAADSPCNHVLPGYVTAGCGSGGTGGR